MFSFEAFLRIETFLRSVYRLAYLNLLWVVTTMLGLVIVGIGPASYALARYLDRWIRHGETPPPTRTFLGYLREAPMKSMGVSWLLLGMGAVIVTNLFLGPDWTLQFLNLMALWVLAVVTAYVFPLMAATRFASVSQLLAAAFLVGFGSLHWTILAAAGSAVTLGILWFASPYLAAAFGVGVPALAVAHVTRVVFRELTQPADLSGLLSKTRRRDREAMDVPTTPPTTKGLAQ